MHIDKPEKGLNSYEPTLRTYLDGERFEPLLPGEVLIGREATPEELKKLAADVRWLLFGQDADITYAIAASAGGYTEWLLSMNKQFCALLDDMNNRCGATSNAIDSAISNGISPGSIRTWATMPGAEAVNSAFTAFNALMNKGYRNLREGQEQWVAILTTLQNAVGAVDKVFKTGLATVGSVAAGYALSKLAFGSGTATVAPSPTMLTTQFINEDVSQAVRLMYQANGVKRVKFDGVAKLAAKRAKQYRKVIMNNRAKRDTAVASYGGTEIALHGSQAKDVLLDAAVEAQLRDHLLLCSAVPCQPGTVDAYMYGDLLANDVLKDASLHRAFNLKFRHPDDEEYYWEYDPADFEIDYSESPYDDYTDSGTADSGVDFGNDYLEYPGDTPETNSSGWDLNDFLSGAAELGKAGLEIWRTVQEVKNSGVAAPQPAPSTGQSSASRFGTPLGVFTWLNNRVVAIPASSVAEYRARANAIIAQFLNDSRLIANSSTEFPFYTATPPFPRNTIVRFSDRAVGVGSTRKKALISYLSANPAYKRTTKSLDHANCNSIFDKKGGVAPSGEFYRSGLLQAVLTDLPAKTYGQIDVGQLPYRIEINRNYVDSRAKVSFVHETLHAITELLKLGLSHEELHALSVFVTSEVLPGYLALEKRLGQ